MNLKEKDMGLKNKMLLFMIISTGVFADADDLKY